MYSTVLYYIGEKVAVEYVDTVINFCLWLWLSLMLLILNIDYQNSANILYLLIHDVEKMMLIDEEGYTEFL